MRAGRTRPFALLAASVVGVSTSVAAAAVPATSVARPAPPSVEAGSPARPAAMTGPLLAGPKVAASARDADGSRPRRVLLGRRGLGPRRWFALYRALDLDGDVRRQANRAVLRLRRQLAAARRAGPGPDAPPDRMTTRRSEIANVQRELWSLLTPAQQDRLREQIRQTQRTPSPRARRPDRDPGAGRRREPIVP